MDNIDLNPFVPQISLFRHPEATFEVHLHTPGVISNVAIVPHGEYLSISVWADPRVYFDANCGQGSLLWTDQPYGWFARDVPFKIPEGTECVILDKRQQDDGYVVQYTVRDIVKKGHTQPGPAVLQDNQERLNVYHGGCESSHGFIKQDMYYNHTNHTIDMQSQSQSDRNRPYPQAVVIGSPPPPQSQEEYFFEHPYHVSASHLSRFQTQYNPKPYYCSDTTMPTGGLGGNPVNRADSGLTYIPSGMQHGINGHGQAPAVSGVQSVPIDLDAHVVGDDGCSGPRNVPTGMKPVVIDHGRLSTVESGQTIVKIELDRGVHQPNVAQPASYIPAQSRNISTRRSVHCVPEGDQLGAAIGSTQPVVVGNDSQGNQDIVDPHGVPGIRVPNNITLGAPYIVSPDGQSFVGGHHTSIARPGGYPSTLGHQPNSAFPFTPTARASPVEQPGEGIARGSESGVTDGGKRNISQDMVESNTVRPDIGAEVNNLKTMSTGEALEYFHERDENIASSQPKTNVRRTCSSIDSHVARDVDVTKTSSQESGSTNHNQSTPASSNAQHDPTAGGLGDSVVVVGEHETLAGGVLEAVHDAILNTTHKTVRQVTTNRITMSGKTWDVMGATIQATTGGSDIILQDAHSREATGSNLPQLTIGGLSDTIIGYPNLDVPPKATESADDQCTSQTAFKEQHTTTFSEQGGAVAQHDTLDRPDTGIPDRDARAVQKDAGKTESSDVRITVRDFGRNNELSSQTQTKWTKIDMLNVAELDDGHSSASAPIDNGGIVARSQVGVGTLEQEREVEEISRIHQQQVVEHGVQSNLSGWSDSRIHLFSIGTSGTLPQGQGGTGSEEHLAINNLQGHEQGLSVLCSGTVSFPSQEHVDVNVTSNVVRSNPSAGNFQTYGMPESGAIASAEGQLLEAMQGDYIDSMSLVDRGAASSESRIQKRANWESRNLSFHRSMGLRFDQGATDALVRRTDGIDEHADPVSVRPNQIQPLGDAGSAGGRGDTKVEETVVVGLVSETALAVQMQFQGTIPSPSNSTLGERPVLSPSHTESPDNKADGVKQSEVFVDSSVATTLGDATIIGISHQTHDGDTNITMNNAEAHETAEGKPPRGDSSTADASVNEGTSREGPPNDIPSIECSGSPLEHTRSNTVITESEGGAQVPEMITQTVQESARSHHENHDGGHIETSREILEGDLVGAHGTNNASSSNSILEGNIATARLATLPDPATPRREELEIVGNSNCGIDERSGTMSTLSVNAENNDFPGQSNHSLLPPEDNLSAKLNSPLPPGPSSPSTSANDPPRGTGGSNGGSTSSIGYMEANIPVSTDQTSVIIMGSENSARTPESITLTVQESAKSHHEETDGSTLTATAANNNISGQYNKSSLPPENNPPTQLISSSTPGLTTVWSSTSVNLQDNSSRGMTGFHPSSTPADPAEMAASPLQDSDQGISTLPSSIAKISIDTTLSADVHDQSEHPEPSKIKRHDIPTPEELVTLDVTTTTQAIAVLGQESKPSATSPMRGIEPLVGPTSSVASNNEVVSIQGSKRTATLTRSMTQGTSSSRDTTPVKWFGALKRLAVIRNAERFGPPSRDSP
ncbi:hypothetical protein BU17DRAFT_79893 [Hysterangium stoloniferum]|nr:hypothetical protein BU17DRAFT_79893 [Hysterangium stoloniferum]